MSIWDYLFDSDWRQRSDIQALKVRGTQLSGYLQSARYSAEQLGDKIKELQSDIAAIALFNQTLLRMLVQKGICTPEEFNALFTEIDLEYGVQDGRITEKPTEEDANFQ